MRLGLFVRAEQRGLGYQSLGAYHALNPAKTLLVVPQGIRDVLTVHDEWYPDTHFIEYDGTLDEDYVRAWVEDLDVVLTFETFYDWRFTDWAREAGCATVCMLNPEFWKPPWEDMPDEWWAPTSWRLDYLPRSVKHVPMPGPNPEDMPQWQPRESGPFRWLHIAGAQTLHDRNGTHAVMAAAVTVVRSQIIKVFSQDREFFRSPCDRVTLIEDDLTERLDLYRDIDGLVFPRRYGGLSIVALEAFACGMPVLMTAMSPQQMDWPVATVPIKRSAQIEFMSGVIDTGNAHVPSLARTMDKWASSDESVSLWRQRSVEYGITNSWNARREEIMQRLAQVVTKRVTR